MFGEFDDSDGEEQFAPDTDDIHSGADSGPKHWRYGGNSRHQPWKPHQ